MDALDLSEALDDSHRPFRDGFASRNPGMMHACGHDGHTTIGLGLAQVLKQYEAQLNGTIKLIFQPAEEGTRARAMAPQRAGRRRLLYRHSYRNRRSGRDGDLRQR